MTKTMSGLFCLAVIVTLLSPLAGCNTIEGLGRDVKDAGEAMTGAAQKNSNGN